MKTIITILAVIIIGIFQVAIAGIIHVPADYSTIQTAIDSASYGDTVLVDPGTYIENIDFHGQTVVVASLFLTTGDTSYISQTIIDGNQDSSVVSIESSEDEGTQLVGFSIRNGLGTGDWPNVRGGGIHISSGAQPLIRYCYIYNNSCVGNSNRGGGIYTRGFMVRISNCKVYGNWSLNITTPLRSFIFNSEDDDDFLILRLFIYNVPEIDILEDEEYWLYGTFLTCKGLIVDL